MNFLKNLDEATFLAGKTSKIYSYGSSHVLRARTLESISYNIGRKVSPGGEEDFFRNITKTARKIFKSLKNTYMINIPDFSYNLEFYKNEWWVVTIEEKINGNSLFEVEIGNRVPFKCIDKLVFGYACYVRDIHKNGESLWNDIKSSQFMYGTNQEGTENLYMVDVDPIVFEFSTKPLIDDATNRLKIFVDQLINDYNSQSIAKLYVSLEILPELDNDYSQFDRHPFKEGVF